MSELGLVTPAGKVVWGKYAQVSSGVPLMLRRFRAAVVSRVVALKPAHQQCVHDLVFVLLTEELLRCRRRSKRYIHRVAALLSEVYFHVLAVNSLQYEIRASLFCC